ncbi:hypothetical protein EJP617_27700 [Erwinia sp. Ejp617]|nr:hypothetical protein EJP617_27700 [Erwinia sp. Ejp617]
MLFINPTAKGKTGAQRDFVKILKASYYIKLFKINLMIQTHNIITLYEDNLSL